MKFALFTHIPWPEGTDPQQVLKNTVEEVCRGEELGYHAAWLAEHHFSRYGIGSSSLVLMGHLAAVTSDIRLGTAVLVPPLQNPIRLAEDAATVDAVSGGRLDVGLGRGTAGYEYKGFDVDREESQGRFQESLKVMTGLWTTPNFSHEGEYYRVNRANLTPPPVQKPYPPVYLAATRTVETLEFVARTGHPLMVGVVLDTADALDLCRRYEKLSRDAGHNVPISEIPFFRYLLCGRDRGRGAGGGQGWNGVDPGHDPVAAHLRGGQRGPREHRRLPRLPLRAAAQLRIPVRPPGRHRDTGAVRGADQGVAERGSGILRL